MKTSICLPLVSAAFFLGGCAAMTTFDSDWKVAVDTHLLGGCSSVDGCSFAKEYALSGYSDRWLDDQVALGGDRELRATIVKNVKAATEEQYAKMVLNGINIGLDAAIQNLQQQQQQQHCWKLCDSRGSR